MIESAKDHMVERRGSDEFEAARQEAEKSMAEISGSSRRSSRSWRRATSVATPSRRRRPSSGRPAHAIRKQDVAAVREQIDGLTRTLRMFKGVVAKTQ